MLNVLALSATIDMVVAREPIELVYSLFEAIQTYQDRREALYRVFELSRRVAKHPLRAIQKLVEPE